MTRLPAPEQWVIHKLNELELAELIEQHIDYVDEDGRSVHLPMPFVRHYMNSRRRRVADTCRDRHCADRACRRSSARA